MATNPVAGDTCQANGETTTGGVFGSGRSCRHRPESETDAGPSLKSLARLCSRDEEERAAALEELSQEVLMSLRLSQPGSARLSKRTLLHLLRLSRSCPLQEVRARATELLRSAEVTNVETMSSVLHRVYTAAGTHRQVEVKNRFIFLQKYVNNW